MRVTKLIRDYVTKEVNNKYSERLNKVGEDYRIKCKKINLLIKEIVEEAEISVQKLLEENQGYGSCHDRIINYYPVTHSAIERKNSTLRGAIMEERKEKTEEILVALELGANKVDLDNMLKNL